MERIRTQQLKSGEGSKVLLTGGSGLLGSTLRKIAPYFLAPSYMEFDVTDFNGMKDYLEKHLVETIIHAAAFTSPPAVNRNPIEAMKVNITGSANITELCSLFKLRLVYISTDYVFKGDKGNYSENDELLPQNIYAWSKLGGECAVRMYSNSLIIRTSFCEDVFPYDKAFIDQYTSRDSVERIAPIILKLALNREITGIVHVGTDRKTVKELAIKLGKKNVGDLLRAEVSFNAPYDTSFNLSRLKTLLGREKK